MSKKRKVEDSELEKVTGGAGIMDDPGSEKFAEADSDLNEAGSEFETHNHNLGNDMIITDGDRG